MLIADGYWSLAVAPEAASLLSITAIAVVRLGVVV